MLFPCYLEKYRDKEKALKLKMKATTVDPMNGSLYGFHKSMSRKVACKMILKPLSGKNCFSMAFHFFDF